MPYSARPAETDCRFLCARRSSVPFILFSPLIFGYTNTPAVSICVGAQQAEAAIIQIVLQVLLQEVFIWGVQVSGILIWFQIVEWIVWFVFFCICFWHRFDWFGFVIFFFFLRGPNWMAQVNHTINCVIVVLVVKQWQHVLLNFALKVTMASCACVHTRFLNLQSCSLHRDSGESEPCVWLCVFVLVCVSFSPVGTTNALRWGHTMKESGQANQTVINFQSFLRHS